VINGWHIFAHPLFLDQVEDLLKQVEGLQKKDPINYQRKNVTKVLAAIAKLAFEIIPQESTKTIYRQGTSLGEEYKHWFRAKFFQQYRLFFRYHAGAKIIGINNRNLVTLEVDLTTTEKSLPKIPDGITIVSESGIRTAADLRRVAALPVDALLVGEGLMRGEISIKDL